MSERRYTSELHANTLVNSLEVIFFFKFTQKNLIYCIYFQ